MNEGTPLSDLLNDDHDEQEPVAVEAAPEPEPEQQEAHAIARDEHGRFAPKKGVEDETAPPAVGLPKEDYKAIREEREKRQTLERELEALKSQFQQLQQPPAPPPSVWEDEQAWGGHLVGQAVQQASLNAKLDMSEMMVRQQHPDFEEVKAEFLSLMAQNPALQQQALADPHPWNKAYQIAKNHRTMRELGATSVDELREKLKAELMAEMQQAPIAPARPGIPPSLTTERNVGTRSGPAWTGPRSLSELLG